MPQLSPASGLLIFISMFMTMLLVYMTINNSNMKNLIQNSKSNSSNIIMHSSMKMF